MPKAVLRAAMVAGLLALGGCSWFEDDDPVTEEPAGPVRAQVPVQAVRTVEIGRTRDGLMVTAFGTAPGLGYALPTLRPRRGGQPGDDGYIELDFVATEPPPGRELPPGTTQSRAVRADLPLRIANLRGARGIRVLTATNGHQVNF